MTVTSLFLALAAVPGVPHGPAPHGPDRAVHSIAFVNDPNSHGLVGDGLLSVNEAIQLHNRTLSTAQLSAAELLQLGGTGADITWVDIDATWTPTITVQQPFDVIMDWPHGCIIRGYNGSPVIDFTGQPHGFRSVSNYSSFQNLLLQGGPYGIDLTQTNALSGSNVINVEFVGHSQFGMRIQGTSAGEFGRVLFERCHFENVPVGILWSELAANRDTLLYIGNTTMTAVPQGLDATFGAGGRVNFWFERLMWDNSQSGIRLRANDALSDRQVLMDGIYWQISSPAPFDLQVAPSATNHAASLRMLDLRCTQPGGDAFRLGPLGGRWTGVVEDSRFAGGVRLQHGGGLPLQAANLRMRDGHLDAGSNGSVPLVLSLCRFDNVTMQSTGSQPVQIVDSCFASGTVAGIAGAPVNVQHSHLGAVAGSFVTVQQPVPQPQLGGFTLMPDQPLLGGVTQLQAELPNGLVGYFGVGPTEQFPLLQPQPLHVYMTLASYVVLPGVYQGQQSVSVAIPNHYLLVDTDWVVQMAVLPLPGTNAPPLSLPPGRRVVLR